MSVWRCPSCGFTQLFSTLHAKSGAITDREPTPKDRDRLVCPNDDTLLEREEDQ